MPARLSICTSTPWRARAGLAEAIGEVLFESHLTALAKLASRVQYPYLVGMALAEQTAEPDDDMLGWSVGRRSSRCAPRGALSVQWPRSHLGGLLASAFAGQSASKAAMVEVPGIEPGSSVASSGLLRAQSATPLLGSTGHADQPV